jgi:magnesium transporter
MSCAIVGTYTSGDLPVEEELRMTAEMRVRWARDGVLNSDEGPHALVASRGASVRWVDVLHPDEATLLSLSEEFALHPLLLEDAVHEQHRPKYDSYPDGAFLTWLFPTALVDSSVELGEVDVFLGPDYLVTLRSAANAIVEDFVTELPRMTSLGSDWLLHAILDRLVDATLPLVDEIGDRLEDAEDRLLGQPTPEDLKELYSIRRQLVALHRIVAPERDILRGLARERNLVSEEAYRYFLDVADHLARVEDAIETYRDVGAAAMDIYLSAQSNRMNAIMKQLTVVATIFMPLTLISGIYGMNVVRGMWPPVLAPWSFAAVVGVMVVIAVWMTLFFRRKNWW